VIEDHVLVAAAVVGQRADGAPHPLEEVIGRIFIAGK
jgi:hypothetical protein